MIGESETVLQVARVCLVLMFPFSALDKVLHWKESLAQAKSSFLPGGPLLLVGAMCLELAAPACIVFQWNAGPAAYALAVFCIATALAYHRFWLQGDFLASRTSIDRQHFWDFTKNIGLAGGLMLLGLNEGYR